MCSFLQVSELNIVRVIEMVRAERVPQVSELENVRSRKCQNWEVSVLQRVKLKNGKNCILILSPILTLSKRLSNLSFFL